MASITEPPEPLTTLDVTFKTATTISLNWTYLFNDSNPKTGVEIQIVKRGELRKYMIRASFTSTTLTSLDAQTMYNITVYVVNANGRSRPSFVSTTTLSYCKSYHQSLMQMLS